MTYLKQLQWRLAEGVSVPTQWAHLPSIHLHHILAVMLVVATMALAVQSLVWQNVAQSRPTIELSQYQLIDKTELAGVTNNASGVTFNPDNNRLYVVINQPELLLELNRDGQVLRQIALEGFEDTEGVVYLGQNQFALIEERRRTLVLVEVTSETDRIKREGLRSLALPGTEHSNLGFEGLAADVRNGRLFVVNEKRPRQLWEVSGFASNSDQNLSIRIPWNLEQSPLGNRDFSGLHFDSVHQTLLMLSDESKQLSEMSMTGELLSRMQLEGGQFGWRTPVPQAEGVAVDDQGVLYVVSEPNLLYRFKKSDG